MLFLDTQARENVSQIFIHVYDRDRQKIMSVIEDTVRAVISDKLQYRCFQYIILVDFNRYYEAWLLLHGGVDPEVRYGQNILDSICANGHVLTDMWLDLIDNYLNKKQVV